MKFSSSVLNCSTSNQDRSRKEALVATPTVSHQESSTLDEDEFLLAVTDNFPTASGRDSYPITQPFLVSVSLYGPAAQERFCNSEFQMSVRFQRLEESPKMPQDKGGFEPNNYTDVAISRSPRVKMTNLTSFDLSLSIEYFAPRNETTPGDNAFRIAMGGDICVDRVFINGEVIEGSSVEGTEESSADGTEESSDEWGDEPNAEWIDKSPLEGTEVEEIDDASVNKQVHVGESNKPKIIMNILPNPNRHYPLLSNLTLNIPPLPNEILCQIFDRVDDNFNLSWPGRLSDPSLYIGVFTSFAQVNRAWRNVIKELNYLPDGEKGREGVNEIQSLSLMDLKTTNWPIINRLLRRSRRLRGLFLDVAPPEDHEDELELNNFLSSPQFLRRVTEVQINDLGSAPTKRRWGWEFVFWWLRERYLVLNRVKGFYLSLFGTNQSTTDALLPLCTPPLPYPFSSPFSLHLDSCYINAFILSNIIPPESWTDYFAFHSSWIWDITDNTKNLFLQSLSKVHIPRFFFDAKLLQPIIIDHDKNDSTINNLMDDGYLPTGPQFNAEDMLQLLSSHPELIQLYITGGTEARCCVNSAVIDGLASLKTLQDLKLRWCIDIDNASVDDFIFHFNKPCNTSFPQLYKLRLSVCCSEADQTLLKDACNNRKCTCEEHGCPCFGSTEAKNWVCVCEQNGMRCNDRRCQCRHGRQTEKVFEITRFPIDLKMADVDDIWP